MSSEAFERYAESVDHTTGLIREMDVRTPLPELNADDLILTMLLTMEELQGRPTRREEALFMAGEITIRGLNRSLMEEDRQDLWSSTLLHRLGSLHDLGLVNITPAGWSVPKLGKKLFDEVIASCSKSE